MVEGSGFRVQNAEPRASKSLLSGKRALYASGLTAILSLLK
jgi:hypothetical protein